MEQTLKTKTYLSFRLGEELFAANVEKVLNILKLKKVTKIPDAPSYLKGVINIRGKVLPIADIRLKFGMHEVNTTIETSIIVLEITLEGKTVDIGIIVDAVCEVFEADTLGIEPSSSIGTRYNVDFIEGLWYKNENIIMLLQMDNVFISDEIIKMKCFEEESIVHI